MRGHFGDSAGPLLTSEEEQELARHNDVWELVRCNLRLITWVVNRWYPGMADLDLESAGLVGLIKAAQRYKAQGTRFAGYAIFWIRRYIQIEIADHVDIVKIPQKAFRDLLLVKKATGEVLLSVAEIQKICRVQLLTAVAYRERVQHDNIELDFENRAERVGGGDLPYKDLEFEWEKVYLWKLLGRLKERERDILIRRFMKGETLATIGKCHNVTRERIRQISVKALAKLKEIYEG